MRTCVIELICIRLLVENTATMMQRTEEFNEKQRAYEDELVRIVMNDALTAVC